MQWSRQSTACQYCLPCPPRTQSFSEHSRLISSQWPRPSIAPCRGRRFLFAPTLRTSSRRTSCEHRLFPFHLLGETAPVGYLMRCEGRTPWSYDSWAVARPLCSAFHCLVGMTRKSCCFQMLRSSSSGTGDARARQTDPIAYATALRIASASSSSALLALALSQVGEHAVGTLPPGEGLS